MTKEELHEIYIWAWDVAIRSVGLIGAGEIGNIAHEIADARITWVNAKAEDLGI